MIYDTDSHSEISWMEKVSMEINLMAGAASRCDVYVCESTLNFLKAY